MKSTLTSKKLWRKRVCYERPESNEIVFRSATGREPRDGLHDPQVTHQPGTYTSMDVREAWLRQL